MHLFAVGWRLSAEGERSLVAEVRRTARGYPHLDPSTQWTASPMPGVVASGQTSPGAMIARASMATTAQPAACAAAGPSASSSTRASRAIATTASGQIGASGAATISPTAIATRMNPRPTRTRRETRQ